MKGKVHRLFVVMFLLFIAFGTIRL